MCYNILDNAIILIMHVTAQACSPLPILAESSHKIRRLFNFVDEEQER